MVQNCDSEAILLKQGGGTLQFSRTFSRGSKKECYIKTKMVLNHKFGTTLVLNLFLEHFGFLRITLEPLFHYQEAGKFEN